MQILRATPATLSQSWQVDGDEADPGLVTVQVTRADGADLYPAGTATTVDGNARTLALTTSDTAQLDRLTVVWTSAIYGNLTDEHEIVGALLFTEAEARAFDKAQFGNATDYPDALLRAARERIGDTLQSITGVAPFPRYRRVELHGEGLRGLLLPDYPILAVRDAAYRIGATWTALDSDDLADLFLDRGGVLTRETRGVWPRGIANVRVSYEHGWERAPLPLKRAALLILVESARKSDIDPRAMSYSDGLSTIRFVTPGLTRGAWFSNPEINAILQLPEYQRAPVVG